MRHRSLQRSLCAQLVVRTRCITHGFFVLGQIERLPSFAQPIFIRLQPQMEITGTFKYRKLDLVQQGFDPAVIDQPLFFKQPGAGYVPLTPNVFAKIGAGAFKL